jgi:hypothetical protein
MPRLAAILLTIWAGSLWTICAFVAPMLFATLERAQAGRMAGRLFGIEAWLGAGLALALMALGTRSRALALRLSPPWLIAATAAAPLISELTLDPMMRAARAAGDAHSFALVHGISAVLFFASCLGALALVWRFNRPVG